MGYIAPVDFHQYRQYHNRHISKSQKQDLTLERVFRAEFQKVKRQKDTYDDELKVKPVPKLSIYQTKTFKYTTMNPDELADITGKGQNFSESV